MLLSWIAVFAGLGLLVWGADRFVDGAAATARYAGMPPLLIGMVIIGFGTSAPEMVVSALSASQGNPGLALGNAYGSNITNIALILGLTAVLCPLRVQSRILRKELPVLLLVTVLALFQLVDLSISRADALVLLAVFALLMGWTIYSGLRQREDSLAAEAAQELDIPEMSRNMSLFWLLIGMLVLVGSSQILVWGAVNVAQAFGVSDLVIGLTIVAIGTSLPELASSIAAVRKGEHDLALGNVIGSNLFNTLAVVGIAGAIHPMTFGYEVLGRDGMFMTVLTISLFLFCFGRGGVGRITRLEGALLLLGYAGYMSYLVLGVIKEVA